MDNSNIYNIDLKSVLRQLLLLMNSTKNPKRRDDHLYNYPPDKCK